MPSRVTVRVSAPWILSADHRLGRSGAWSRERITVAKPGLLRTSRCPPDSLTLTSPARSRTLYSPSTGPPQNSVPRTPIWATGVATVMIFFAQLFHLARSRSGTPLASSSGERRPRPVRDRTRSGRSRRARPRPASAPCRREMSLADGRRRRSLSSSFMRTAAPFAAAALCAARTISAAPSTSLTLPTAVIGGVGGAERGHKHKRRPEEGTRAERTIARRRLALWRARDPAR